ncbi:MAG TPA: CYTH domain-containing protein [Acholeplasma sp.]|nr:CYTH domain-containing protein [Acholeplasma sp.]
MVRESNMEIEFKTSIEKDKYLELLELFDLEENIYKQTNYYFDTDDLVLSNNKTVLRIRKKGGRYKVTLKRQSDVGAFENHVFITEEQALDMIENGFNSKTFFEDIDYDVKFRASLDNYRASAPYLEGVLFLDRCEYHDIVDFEVEYEYFDFNEGEKIFKALLKEHNIDYVKTKRKSEKALSTK